jgi:Anti-sigma factor NepR
MSKRADRKRLDAGKESDLGSDEEMLERGFDRWLNGQLHRIYDPVLTEPVPDEIARLLEQFELSPNIVPSSDDEGQH